MMCKHNRQAAATVLALIVIAGLATTQKIDLDKNIELPVEGVTVNNKTRSVLSPFFAKDGSTSVNGQKIALISDLTYDRLLIPNSNGSSYGVRCEAGLLCEITGQKEECTYGPVTVYDCQSGSTLLRYRDGKAVDANVQQVDAYFYNSTNFWETQLGKYGVFGMGPKSPIWNYLATAFYKQPEQKAIETSLCYRVKDYKSSVEESVVQLTDSFFTVNGRYGINDPVVQQFKHNTYSQWVYEGVTITYNRNVTRNSAKLCIDNTQNYYFLTSNSADLKVQILRKLCGKDDRCLRSESDLEKVDQLKIQFESSGSQRFSMTIKPEEFINFDTNEKAVIAIGDIGESKCKDAGQNVNDAIGRLMLTKIEFIVRVAGQDNFEIGFNEIVYPNDTVFLFILIVLGAIIVLVILGIIVASSISRKKAEDRGTTSYANHTAIIN